MLAQLPLHAHELATGRLLVAEAAGNVVGFGATLERSGTTYLADLFVRPEHQGRGIGRSLVDALLADVSGPLFTFASETPSAQHLYFTMGMNPVGEFSYLRAEVANLELVNLDERTFGTNVEELNAELFEIDRRVTLRDRRVDMEYAQRDIGSRYLVAKRGDEAVGYGAFTYPFLWPDPDSTIASVGPIVAVHPSDCVPLLLATIAMAAATSATSIEVMVPVTSHAHRLLLSAGFTVFSADLYMASESGIIDPTRYLPSVDCA